MVDNSSTGLLNTPRLRRASSADIFFRIGKSSRSPCLCSISRIPAYHGAASAPSLETPTVVDALDPVPWDVFALLHERHWQRKTFQWLMHRVCEFLSPCSRRSQIPKEDTPPRTGLAPLNTLLFYPTWYHQHRPSSLWPYRVFCFSL